MLRSLLTASTFFLLASAAASAQMPVADEGSVYAGPDGIHVELALVEPASVLVRLRRTGSVFDGLVALAEVRDNGSDVSYVIDYRGRDWHVVRVRDGYYGREHLLFPPGTRDEFRLAYDEEDTEALDTAALAADLADDAAEVEALARFDRDFEEEEEIATVAEAQAAVEAECGVALDVEMRWDTVSDEALKTYAIGSFAATPLDALARWCRSDDILRAVIAEHVRAVTVSFDAPMHLVADGETLHWHTNGDAPNQSDFAYYVLANLLRTAY